MQVVQSTKDNRVSQKTVCTIDLTEIAYAKRFHSDPDVKAEATAILNAAYQCQMDCEALAERLQIETLASLEAKHVNSLLEKDRLEAELRGLNSRTIDFNNEAERVGGRVHQAQTLLSAHLATKKTWNPGLVLPSTKAAWEAKLKELESNVEEARGRASDLQLEIQDHNGDKERLANRVRVATAEALEFYAKIERLKGSPEPIMDRSTGLPT